MYDWDIHFFDAIALEIKHMLLARMVNTMVSATIPATLAIPIMKSRSIA